MRFRGERSVYTRGGGEGTAADGAAAEEMKNRRSEAWRVSHAERSVYTRGGGEGTAADGALNKI